MELKLLRSNMKKYIIFSLLIVNLGFGQNPEIKTELPSVIPPSPTVSALMKFEEVPVSNYTGIPDISIPLYSMPTTSKDIALNLALKYHPASIQTTEASGEVGLAWNLIKGGTISRTVRGLPDEILDLNHDNPNSRERIGIYHSNYNVNHKNYYYYFNENLTNQDKNYYVTGPISADEYYNTNKFIWGSKDMGKYDSEHDLWQFNFMGHNGRFYIKLNQATSSLEVIPLDNYELKIEYNYGISGNINNPYTPESFTIFDEKGYKYIFDIVEKSYIKSSFEGYYGSSTSMSTSQGIENISAFHLSRVIDNNNNIILEFSYSDINDYSEVLKNSYYEYNQPFDMNTYMQFASSYNCNGEFLPLKSYVNNLFITRVRKLLNIDIRNVGNVEFQYNFQRSDSNIDGLHNNSFALSSFIVKDKKNNIIKAYNFDYDYSIILDDIYDYEISNRLMLKKVEEYSNGIAKKYEFEYYDQVFSGFTVGSDYWGYFNLIPSCAVDNQISKFPSPEFSTRDLLKKIKYPTGGCAIFDFGANTYSYQGDVAIQDFYQDDQNIQLIDNDYVTFNNTNNSLYLGVLSNNYKKIVFGPSIVHEDISIASRTLLLKKKVNNSWVGAGSILQCSTENCCIEFYPEAGVEYKVDYVNLDIQYNGNETLSILYYSPNLPNQFLYGGGNRINRIGYFDQDVDKNFFINGTFSFVPAKLVNFDYTQPNSINKSSGSLVYIKPSFSYDRKVPYSTGCRGNETPVTGVIDYQTLSSNNIYKGLRTNGSEIGYKHVKVWELNNGKKEYTYFSPIDFPDEIEINPLQQHIPSKNIDYKRGLIENEKTFSNQDKLLSESDYNYEFVENEEQTGLLFLKSYLDNNYQGIPLENNYDLLKHNYDNNINIKDCYEKIIGSIPGWPSSEGSMIIVCYDRSNINFHNIDQINQRNIFIRPVIEAYGWAKLINKTTKNYFYPNGSSTPNIVESVETYAYNPINKKISESTVSNSRGETLTTKYFYHTGNSIHSQNRISEIERIETYKASELLSKSQIIYNNNWTNNVSFLPQTIQTAKGSEGYENRLQYLNYDEFGNPLEVKQEGGIPICYIWGYNKTQPIAKIENATYAQVQPHAANLQTLSNGNDEQGLISALNNLRTALPNAMITTYTYKPLIGISTVTDPKGDRQTYHYDSFNRLQFVKDAQGNILSENQYHYRTQN